MLTMVGENIVALEATVVLPELVEMGVVLSRRIYSKLLRRDTPFGDVCVPTECILAALEQLS